MTRRAVLGLIVAGLLLTTAASQVRRETTNASTSAAPITIPFELINRHIILKVSVNKSRPLSFVLDTGDKFAIIDLDRAKELGLNLQGQVRAGGAGSESPTGSFVRDSTFTIAGFEQFSQPISLALPVNRLASRLGNDFDGIIGADFIQEFVVEVDYQARVLKLHNKDRFNYSGLGESIPIRLNQAGHPILQAEVTPIGSETTKGEFVLDIGSGGALILYSPFVTERRLLGPNLKTINALGGAGAGGEIKGQLGRVAEFRIGKFRITNPITMFSEDKTGALASSALLGNVGAQIASKFRLFLDYSHNRIILEPNSTFAAPFDRAFSGLSVHAEGKDYRTFRVIEILESSPATEAGLQKDDIISAVDGKPAAEMTLSKLSELFERPIPYRLTVRRGEQTLQLTLTPRRLV